MQVAPSFFDAPGAQAAGKVTPRQKVGGLAVPASFSSQHSPLCNTSTATLQRLPQDLPDVTFAFVSESGYKVKTHQTTLLPKGFHHFIGKTVKRTEQKQWALSCSDSASHLQVELERILFACCLTTRRQYCIHSATYTREYGACPTFSHSTRHYPLVFTTLPFLSPRKASSLILPLISTGGGRHGQADCYDSTGAFQVMCTNKPAAA